MHYLINITRFITDEAAESIKHKYMYLLFDERVYLVTKVATSTHNPTSFFAITTFWEFINRIIKTLLAIIAWKVSGALSQPVKGHRILKIYLSRCIQVSVHISFLTKLPQQLSSPVVKRWRLTHILQVPHVEPVCVVDFAKEISVRVLEHAVVVPDDATFVVRTAIKDFLGCLRNTGFTFWGWYVATAKSKTISLLVLVYAHRGHTKACWRGLVDEWGYESFQVWFVGTIGCEILRIWTEMEERVSSRRCLENER